MCKSNMSAAPHRPTAGIIATDTLTARPSSALCITHTTAKTVDLLSGFSLVRFNYDDASS